jgi:hypothetical protein
MKKPFSLATVLLTSVVSLLFDMSVAQAEVSPETLKSISIPDSVETPIGKLEFFDGVPSDATIDTLYDNLDRMRAVEVYLNNQGAGSLNAMRAGNASIGANRSNVVPISEQLLKPESLYLTGNTSTLYAVNYLDLKPRISCNEVVQIEIFFLL